jgi:hypothetical protein
MNCSALSGRADLYGALLVGVLAYRLQEPTLDGLEPATRRLLRQVAGHPAVPWPIAH